MGALIRGADSGDKGRDLASIWAELIYPSGRELVKAQMEAPQHWYSRVSEGRLHQKAHGC